MTRQAGVLYSSRLVWARARGQPDILCPALRSSATAYPHTLARGDTPDLATGNLGEPDIAIRPGRNARRSALGCGDMERGEAAAGRDASDRADIEFRKPEIAI